MKYYKSLDGKSFGVYANFVPKKTPEGFVEITKEQYDEEMEKRDERNEEEHNN